MLHLQTLRSIWPKIEQWNIFQMKILAQRQCHLSTWNCSRLQLNHETIKFVPSFLILECLSTNCLLIKITNFFVNRVVFRIYFLNKFEIWVFEFARNQFEFIKSIREMNSKVHIRKCVHAHCLNIKMLKYIELMLSRNVNIWPTFIEYFEK